MISHLERVVLNQALAKAIAHHNAGNQTQAMAWSAKLLSMLDTMDLADQTQLSHYLHVERK